MCKNGNERKVNEHESISRIFYARQGVHAYGTKKLKTDRFRRKTDMRHFSLVLLVIFAFCFFGCQSPNESNYIPLNDPAYTPPADIPPNESPVDIPPEIVGEGYFFYDLELRNFPQDRYFEPNQDIWWNSSGGSGPFILLSSVEEVHELLGETYSVSLIDCQVRDDRFENILKKYDYRFFENNQVLTLLISATGIERFELNNATYQDDILTVELDLSDKRIGPAFEVLWFAFIEIEKKSAETPQVEIIMNRTYGSSDEMEIGFKIGSTTWWDSSYPIKPPLEVIVDSLEEWSGSDYAEVLELDEKYDSGFFTNNSLVLVLFTTPTIVEVCDIKVSKFGDHLLVGITGMDTASLAIGGVGLALEVRKEDIVGIKSISFTTNLDYFDYNWTIAH